MAGVAWETAYSTSGVVSLTEISLTSLAAFSTGVNNPGKFVGHVLMPSAAINSDQYRFRAYKVVNGQTIAQVWDMTVVGRGTAFVVELPELASASNWDFTAVSVAGTHRTLHSQIDEETASGGSGGSVDVLTWNGATVTAASGGLISVDAKKIVNVTPAMDAGGSIVVNAGGSIDASVLDSRITGTILMQAGGTVVTQAGGVAADVNVVTWNGATVSAAVAGIIDVNTVQISGDATAADNAKAMFDGTGYNATATTITAAAAGVRAAVGLAAANLDTQLTAIDDYIDTEVAAINNKLTGTILLEAGGTVTISAAGVRSAVGLASANLDTQIAAVQSGVDAINFKVASTLSLTAAGEIIIGSITTAAGGILAAFIADEVYDDSLTLRQSIRLANSANAGKLSGAATTNVLIRDIADTKNRINATVDADGNRTAITRDVS